MKKLYFPLSILLFSSVVCWRFYKIESNQILILKGLTKEIKTRQLMDSLQQEINTLLVDKIKINK